MLNMPAPEEATETTASLSERIAANRDQLTRATEQASESRNIASIFGWDY